MRISSLSRESLNLRLPRIRRPPGLRICANRGAKRLLVHVARGTGGSGIPEMVSVSFAGGGRWLIQVDLGRQFELWAPIWDTLGLHERGWLVTYQRHKIEKPIVLPAPSLDLPERRLVSAIRRNKDLASEALAKGQGD